MLGTDRVVPYTKQNHMSQHLFINDVITNDVRARQLIAFILNSEEFVNSKMKCRLL
jgi:hypothetical protein